ncbi:MATE family efflux transporter [Pelagibius sp. Alg239-R121]|uniref:MATE family efflux transporter n=1 Tax=Pelagibius sp. Alg239-R121 TaxID=2993448 RepID=UPI0024A623E7|nr:MATE family efflux transporter [Pelagibius sp. Alg239-R121]
MVKSTASETPVRVWALAWPIIVTNLSTPLLGAVDTAVMGHLPDAAYIGGVAVGAIIFGFLLWGFGFLRMGTTGFAAQAFGADDAIELRAALIRPLALGAGLGALLILLQAPIAALVFPLIDASQDVTAFAKTYYEIRIWSAPATLLQYGITGWLLGLQRPWAAMATQITVNLLNILLDLFFVLELGWGVEGVAVATLLAEIAGTLVGLAIVYRSLHSVGGTWNWPIVWRRDRLVALFRVNRDIFVRNLCLIMATSIFTAQSAAMSDTLLAANAILINLQQFLAHGLDGFAHAAEILGGGAVGARDRSAFRRIVLSATRLTIISTLLISVAYAVFGAQIIGLFTDIDAVIAAALIYLPWMIASPALSAPSFLLDGLFIGATRTAAMRNAMVASLLVFLAAGYLLIPAMGNHGLWLAFMIFMVARAVTLAVAYPALERSISAPGRNPVL